MVHLELSKSVFARKKPLELRVQSETNAEKVSWLEISYQPLANL